MEPTIKKSIGKWKKVKKIFLAKKHSKASYLQIAGLRYKNLDNQEAEEYNEPDFRTE